MRGQNGAARFRLHAGAGRHRCAKGFHQRAAIGLLVVAHAHHVDLAVQAKERARHRQRRAPLPRARLRGQMLGAFLLVVVSLRHGRVQLVRPGRARALVLVVDVRRRIERLLKPARAVERRRTPLRINLPHLFRNLDLALGAHFLQESGSSETAEPDRRDRWVCACRGAAAAPSASADRESRCTRHEECDPAADCIELYPCATFYQRYWLSCARGLMHPGRRSSVAAVTAPPHGVARRLLIEVEEKS